MREIKFRAKSTADGLWVYGDLLRRYGNVYIVTEDSEIQADPATVGQYTSLKDTNGVEIYIHDAVSIIGGRGVPRTLIVVWDERNARCVLNDPKLTMIGYEAFNGPAQRSIEIIGNIHDNPELLK